MGTSPRANDGSCGKRCGGPCRVKESEAEAIARGPASRVGVTRYARALNGQHVQGSRKLRPRVLRVEGRGLNTAWPTTRLRRRATTSAQLAAWVRIARARRGVRCGLTSSESGKGAAAVTDRVPTEGGVTPGDWHQLKSASHAPAACRPGGCYAELKGRGRQPKDIRSERMDWECMGA